MKKILWLASYPKSGNTWVRAFLSCLLKDNADDHFLNDLVALSVSSRIIYDNYLDIDTAELPYEELEVLRPPAIRSYAKEIAHAPFFMKVHDAYTYTSRNESLFPDDISIGAIYLVRNPVDIVPSFSHHLDDSIDNIIKFMGSENAALASSAQDASAHIKQHLGSWSAHVKSWTEQKNIPVLLLKYEDMLKDPFANFKQMVSFSGLQFTDEEIASAVEKCSFKNLQRLEQESGFKERFSSVNPFFRKGKTGTGKEELTPGQVDALVNRHREVMEALGYTGF